MSKETLQSHIVYISSISIFQYNTLTRPC